MQDIEDRVLSAATEFAASLTTGRNTADMSPLIEATSSLALTNLDDRERLIRWGIYRAAERQRVPKWRLFPRTHAPFPTWIDLCHGDGLKRERALRTLTGPAPNRFFFAMAVRRLNDWVPQVRTAAHEQLPAIAAASRPSDVAQVLCAVLPHWGSWARMQAQEKRTLLDITSIEAVTHAIKSNLVSGTAGPLAAVLAQLGRTPSLDVHLPYIASNAIQPSVRAKAYRSLLEQKMTWLDGWQWEWTDVRQGKRRLKPVYGERPLSLESLLEDTLTAASTDRSPFVRSVAGAILIRDPGKLGMFGVRLATRLASDKHPSLSARGRFVLDKLLKTD